MAAAPVSPAADAPVDVLVAHSYYLRHDPKQAQKARPYPPLATLYLGASLRRAGYRVAVFDAMLAEGEEQFAEALARHRPAVVALYEDNFNFLSKMCLGRMREAACTMADMGRRAGAYVIAAGSDVTDHAEVYLVAGAHAAVLGEGDHTVRELVDWLAAAGHEGERPVHIAGLALAPLAGSPATALAGSPATALAGSPATAGRVLRTPERRNERHPDVFGFPARDLVDIEAYRRLWQDQHGFFSLNMVSTRGCPFHCNWCAKPIWGQRYAMRSPEDVAAELDEVKRTIAPDHIWFADDIFGLRPAWVAAFAERVNELDASIPFTIQSRCDLMSELAVAGLAAAGCRQVWLGAESGSQRILDAMDKGIGVDDIRAARSRLGDAGVAVGYFVQFGYPGEEWDDIWATVALVRSTLPDEIGVSVSYPLPGTRFHAMVADELGAKTNWADSGDLDMMFRGTFTSAFYRRLHAALHDDLDLHRRRAGLAPAPHPSVTPTTIEDQTARVAATWRELADMALSHRNERPTLLLRVEPTRAPDLSRSHN